MPKARQRRMERQMDSLLSVLQTDRRTDRDEIKQEIRSCQEHMDVKLKEMREEIKYGQAEMRSIVDAWMTNVNDARRKTTACQETTKANTEKTEPDPGMMQSIKEHQEIPKG
jgi:hypothetical protein